MLVVRHYPNPGGRDALKLPLTGSLVSAGMGDDAIEGFILAVATAARDDQARERANNVKQTRTRFEQGKPVARWKALGEVLSDGKLAKTLRTWLQPIDADQRAQWQPQNREDFYAFLPEHKYIFIPTGSMWPAESVGKTVKPVVVGYDDDGEEITQSPGHWLDTHRPVHQRTWIPGVEQLIEGRIFHEGGWMERADLRVFNLYTPPTVVHGDPNQVGPWLDHVRMVFPEEADHIIGWLAHRVQRPGEKINHALVFGGAQGIGKDTIMAPVREAVGMWNVEVASPERIMGQFNDFLRSVILEVPEIRDLGDSDRFKFYERMKTIIAAPPDVLSVNEKYINPYMVPNVCGVVFTTNDLDSGVYLPAGDRRHFVAASELPENAPGAEYFAGLYRWFGEGGNNNVAAFLAGYDLSNFDPKAPPPKTPGFHRVIAGGSSPVSAEMADIIEEMGDPAVVVIQDIVDTSSKMTSKFETMSGGIASNLGLWLNDTRNATKIPRLMNEAGYVKVLTETGQGQWRIKGKRTIVYGRKELSRAERIQAAEAFRS